MCLKACPWALTNRHVAAFCPARGHACGIRGLKAEISCRFVMKLQKTPKGQYYLTPPKKIVEAKKWGKGQKLKAVFNERGNIELEEEKK